MRYLDEIRKYKYFEFYKELLEYMFEKFELSSEEDEDVVFGMLGWDLSKMDSDLDVGINNGYSLEIQMKLAKYKLSKELEIEKEYEKEKKWLDTLLEEYSKSSNKNP